MNVYLCIENTRETIIEDNKHEHILRVRNVTGWYTLAHYRYSIGIKSTWKCLNEMSSLLLGVPRIYLANY